MAEFPTYRYMLGFTWDDRYSLTRQLLAHQRVPQNNDPSRGFQISHRQFVAMLYAVEAAEKALRGKPSQFHLPSFLAGLDVGSALPPPSAGLASSRDNSSPRKPAPSQDAESSRGSESGSHPTRPAASAETGKTPASSSPMGGCTPMVADGDLVSNGQIPEGVA